MDLKHILPIEANYALKHLKNRFRPQELSVDKKILTSSKRVFFPDVPAYGNIGDQAIAFAMETFIAEVLPEYKQIEITEDQLPSSINWIRKTIQNDDIICLTGGGNMGVMYQRYESARRMIIKNFPNNPIVIFPQTFGYENNNYAKRELIRAKKLYGAVKNLIICARDEESHKQMKKCFQNATVIFCPDIVLYLDYRGKFKRRDDVGICLRNDRERMLTDAQHVQLSKLYPTAKTLTTMDNGELPITCSNRKTVVESKLQEFGSKRLILTDRLHGTIFAFITGTTCISFPNSNGKVERVCKYLSEKGNVIFTKDVDCIITDNAKENGTVRDRFGELIDALRYIAIS